jgi:glycosyltransferase involved in cell wall biosynthesis
MAEINWNYGQYPKVTIGVPTRNNCDTIGQTLDSIINQNYPNLEVLVSNDASTDLTEQIVSDFADRFNFVKLINQSENLGLYENMEFLLVNCDSDYFMWLAGDDFISDDYILNNLQFLEENREFVASSSVPAYTINGVTYIGNPIQLNCDKGDRVRNFLQRPDTSHNVFYSLFRTEVGKGFPYLGLKYAAADWVFDLFLISQGKINTNAGGFINFGTNGISRSPNANRKFKTSTIEIILPLWPMSKYLMCLKGFGVFEKLQIFRTVTKLNLRQFKSDLKRMKLIILGEM